MLRPMNPRRFVAVLLAVSTFSIPAPAQEREEGGTPGVIIVVKAGSHRRLGTPVRFEVPSTRFDSSVRKAVEVGPVLLGVTLLRPKRSENAGYKMPITRSLAQAEKLEGSPNLRVTFILEDVIAAGFEGRYSLSGLRTIADKSWSFDESKPGSLELKYRDLPVFRYNAAPVSSPNYKEIQVRDAYIHPAYSPLGALITGDFSSSHPHHRGFFLAYERTKTGDLTPDFWNIHLGTGKIHADGLDKPVVGPVTARFSARHRWEAKNKATGKGVVVLRERWEVEAYAIPYTSYWLFDVTSTQQGVDRPFEVLPYRYGGMAYRGPEPFVKGLLDVLTSEGKHRKDGDQKPARWVDLTGPIAEGSDRYAGAMIADHPSNPHYPNVVRIHPTVLPFFSFVPAYDRPLIIAADAPSVFRYRVMIHDGHPDPTLDEEVARDFAEPPMVAFE